MTKEHLEYIKKIKNEKRLVIISQVLLLIFFILIWELFSHLKIIDPFIFSQPSKIFGLFIDYTKSGELFIHTLVSTYEVILGLLIGTLVGLIISVLLYEIKFLSKIFDPYLVVLNALPKTALAPIFIIWVGTNTSGIVFVSISISLIITIINGLNALNNIEEDKIKLFKTFGANKWQILRYLLIPANTNEILNIIRINIGMSWIGVIVAEFIVSKRGLGYLITYGTQIFRLDIVMMGVVTLAVVTILMYQTLNLIAKIIKGKKGF